MKCKQKKQLCGVMVKRGVMTEARPCIREKGHGGGYEGGHTPNLEGMQLENCAVGKRGPDFIFNSGRRIRWYVSGRSKPIQDSDLINGHSRGLVAEKNSGKGTQAAPGKTKPEYRTAHHHLQSITDKNHQQHNAYKDMKIYRDWDCRCNGLALGKSAQLAMRWIQDNLGPKPSSEHQLHVLKTKKYSRGFFGPGGIVWRHQMDRHEQDLLDLVAEWPKKKQIQYFTNELRRLKAA